MLISFSCIRGSLIFDVQIRPSNICRNTRLTKEGRRCMCCPDNAAARTPRRRSENPPATRRSASAGRGGARRKPRLLPPQHRRATPLAGHTRRRRRESETFSFPEGLGKGSAAARVNAAWPALLPTNRSRPEGCAGPRGKGGARER